MEKRFKKMNFNQLSKYKHSHHEKLIPCKIEDIEKILKEIIQKIKPDYNIHVVSLHSDLYQMGFDSIDITELFMNLEYKFDKDVSDHEMEQCHTILDVINIMRSKF